MTKASAPRPTAVLVVVAFLAVAGCELVLSSDGEPEPERPVAQSVEMGRQLDVLFVVDNSGSMAEEQQQLADQMEGFVAELQELAGNALDMHLGVVSTNTGALPGVAGCEAAGDRGALQRDPRLSGCEALAESFVAQTIEADGAITTNVETSLGEALRCIVPLGVTGCGFESPLEAARLALDGSNPANAGFLRDEATLVLVILTNEDDCSVADRGSFYDDPTAAIDSPLGVFSSFRCFEFGVQCDRDDPREVGAKTGCESRTGSLLEDVADYIAFFDDLKGPGRVIVRSIHGQPQASAGGGFDAVVIPNPNAGQLAGTPLLGTSCLSQAGEAQPAIRLEEFVRSFAQGATSSICEGVGLANIAGAVERSLATACLVGPIDGLECVARVEAPASPRQPLPPCLTPGDTGCFEMIANEASCDGGGALHVRHAIDAAIGTRVVAQCNPVAF